MTDRIRVVLADDQALVRAGFRALLAHEDDITVVGEAADGRAAVELARRFRPDVMLMDIRMPVLDGIAATEAICADITLPNVRVVVLTTYALDEYVFAALRAGASGFLLKDLEPEELRSAVRVVASGHALLAPAVTRTLIQAYTAEPRPSPAALARLATLTDRERELTVLAAQGHDNRAIGDGGNPAKSGTPGGGSGGAIYNDGNKMTLTILGSRIEHNEVNAYGSAVFFVSNDHSGNIVIEDSTITNNVGGSWYPTYPQISNHDDTPIAVKNSVIE